MSNVSVTQPAGRVYITVVEPTNTVTVSAPGDINVGVALVGVQGGTGPRGPSGLLAQATPPTDTTIIWVDTSI